MRILVVIAVTLLLTPVLAAAKMVRLDPNVSPTFQAVELDLDANKRDYRGSVRIEIEVEARTTEFKFHAEEMTLEHVGLQGDRRYVILTEVGEDGVVTATTEELPPGKYTLSIDFRKEFNTKAVGLYRMEKDGQGYLFTQFEAVDARKAFPCWDEPGYKIPWRLTIRIPSEQTAVTNTPVETSEAEGPRTTYVYRKTPPMPSYLIAIAAGPFESTPIPDLSVPGYIYTLPGQSDLTGLAAKYTAPILEALEEYFEIPYPYEKLDLIAIPEYWPGAMENPGLVTWADHLLLMDTKSASVRQRQRLAYIQAHELAHMWFGDLVTMAWWDDLWLNEAFATWLGGKIAHKLYPEYEVELDLLAEVQDLLGTDARPSTKPVRKTIDSNAAIFEDLLLAYAKGDAVIAMVEKWIGPDKFREGVVAYIKDNEWGNATADDLFNHLSAASGKNVAAVMASFLDQPGYPMVSVEVKGTKLVLSQRRFLNYGVTADDFLWTIPVQLKYSDGKSIQTKTVLFDKKRDEVTLGKSVEWVLPDAGSVGYYRWSIPGDMLVKIAAEPAATMEARERATFLANCKALLDAGAMRGDDYLKTLNAYAASASPEIVDAVLTQLSDVRNAFITDDLIEPFAEYVRRTLAPAYERVGLSAKKDEPDAIALIRPRLLSWLGTEGMDEEVRVFCRETATGFMGDPTSVDPSLGGVALQVAAIDGDRAAFETYKKHFTAAQAPDIRDRYLSALGSFHEAELQRDALDFTIGDDVRPTELFAVPQQVGRAPGGKQIVYEWLTANYDVIASRLPPDFVSFLPFFVTGCSRERMEAARAFFAEPGHSVEGTMNNLDKASDSIRDCASLRDREGAAVADYLNALLASP